ncbi:MAG: hypothetical protein LBB34_02810 [Holosporales bacterium]|nr:hypothetical protein [Holosporales bacterium]
MLNNIHERVGKDFALQILKLYEERDLFVNPQNEQYQELKEKLLKQDQLTFLLLRDFVWATRGSKHTDLLLLNSDTTSSFFSQNGNHPIAETSLAKNENYIKIGSFYDIHMVEVFEKIENILHYKKNITLDLRDNLGGRIENCLKLFAYFMPNTSNFLTLRYKKKVVYSNVESIGNHNQANVEIFINSNTASCAEIFAFGLKHFCSSGTKLSGSNPACKDFGQDILTFDELGVRMSIVSFMWEVDGYSIYDLVRKYDISPLPGGKDTICSMQPTASQQGCIQL